MINIPTAVIFFARPDLLEITFAQIKKAKPNKLFLIQDGPRINNTSDPSKILECRSIVENIDWDCEVFKNYSDENLGVGKRVYTGLNWAFEHVDRLLIIEDDCVPALSLFPFTAELLEKYKDDERVGMICGMNNFGKSEEISDDYFFSYGGSIWGWATWKRVWNNMDFQMEFLKDEYSCNHVFVKNKYLIKRAKRLSENLIAGKKLSSWSFQHGMNLYLNNQLNIVPKYNMISNIGLHNESGNSVSSIKFIPKALRKLYYMKSYKIQFPLSHPKYIVDNNSYKLRIDAQLGVDSKSTYVYRKIESLIYRILGLEFKSISKSIRNSLK